MNIAQIHSIHFVSVGHVLYMKKYIFQTDTALSDIAGTTEYMTCHQTVTVSQHKPASLACRTPGCSRHRNCVSPSGRRGRLTHDPLDLTKRTTVSPRHHCVITRTHMSLSNMYPCCHTFKKISNCELPIEQKINNSKQQEHHLRSCGYFQFSSFYCFPSNFHTITG